jgi:membrane-bound ClpP family serine protease
VPVLLAFGATFGAVGAIMEELNVDSMLTVIIAVIVGVVVAGGMYGLVYVLIVKSQSSTHIHSSDLVGLEGVLTVGIKNKEPGSVVVNHEKRGRVPLSATAIEDIETNTPVRIVKVAGDAVFVERMNGAGAAQQRKEG